MYIDSGARAFNVPVSGPVSVQGFRRLLLRISPHAQQREKMNFWVIQRKNYCHHWRSQILERQED